MAVICSPRPDWPNCRWPQPGARHVRSPAIHHNTADSTTIRTPTAIAVSCQNTNGNSWTSRSVPGRTCRYRPRRTVGGTFRTGHRTRPARRPRGSRRHRQDGRATPDAVPEVLPIEERCEPEHDERRPGEHPSPTNTVRTSRMWPRSRSLSTGSPFTSTSKSAGPTTRSSTIAFVTRASSASEKPVQAADSARPCSNASHGELRNGRTATLTITIAVAMPTRVVLRGRATSVPVRWRSRQHGSPGSPHARPTVGPGQRPAGSRALTLQSFRPNSSAGGQRPASEEPPRHAEADFVGRRPTAAFASRSLSSSVRA